MTEPTKIPTPAELLHEVEFMPSRFKLADYLPVVLGLRGKGLTAEQIAQWLSQRGVIVFEKEVAHLLHKNPLV